mgnify:CR=1 FL=1
MGNDSDVLCLLLVVVKLVKCETCYFFVLLAAVYACPTMLYSISTVCIIHLDGTDLQSHINLSVLQ